MCLVLRVFWVEELKAALCWAERIAIADLCDF